MKEGRPSFENTEVAFAHKSNKDLKNARLLFNAFKFPFLVHQGPKLAEWCLKFGLPIKGIIKNTVFKQFCGGESIEDCKNTSLQLAESRIGTILDYSVEGENTEENFDATFKEILKTVEASATNIHIPFCVFKVTGVIRFELMQKMQSGETLSQQETEEWNRGRQRVHTICREADKAKTRVLIDAEESWIQNVIDELTVSMMEEFNQDRAVVYNTIQLYRHDRLAYLEKCIKELPYHQGYKLVRGAYMEKERERALEMGYPSPIQPDKESTDRDYNLGIEACLNNMDKVELCAGTHNEESSMLLTELLDKLGLSKDHPKVHFAQLLGMSDHISYNLANSGYHVAKYVPYGPVKSVMPYLGRRAQENSSIGGQVGRELHLIQTELKRRKG